MRPLAGGASQAPEEDLSEGSPEVAVENCVDDWIDSGIAIAHPNDEALNSGRYVFAADNANSSYNVEGEEGQPGTDEGGHDESKDESSSALARLGKLALVPLVIRGQVGTAGGSGGDGGGGSCRGAGAARAHQRRAAVDLAALAGPLLHLELVVLLRLLLLLSGFAVMIIEPLELIAAGRGQVGAGILGTGSLFAVEILGVVVEQQGGVIAGGLGARLGTTCELCLIRRGLIAIPQSLLSTSRSRQVAGLSSSEAVACGSWLGAHRKRNVSVADE